MLWHFQEKERTGPNDLATEKSASTYYHERVEYLERRRRKKRDDLIWRGETSVTTSLGRRVWCYFSRASAFFRKRALFNRSDRRFWFQSSRLKGHWRNEIKGAQYWIRTEFEDLSRINSCTLQLQVPWRLSFPKSTSPSPFSALSLRAERELYVG